MYKISQIPHGSTLLYIGDLYNKASKGWMIVCYFTHINGYFFRQPLPVDLLPLLIIGKTYPSNDLENSRGGYRSSFVLPPQKNWQLFRYEQVPEGLKKNRLLSSFSKEISRQWVFRIEATEEIIWIPVIELAKALFLHSSEIVRAAVLEGNPHQLAKAIQNDRAGKVMFESHTPLLFINSMFYRQVFTWLMFDDAAQASFGSIFHYLNKESRFVDNALCWTFRFSPPNLYNCSLTWSGYTGLKSKGEYHHRFINEITSVAGVAAPALDTIEFSHPSDKSTYHAEKGDEENKERETPHDQIPDLSLIDIDPPKSSGKRYTIEEGRSGFHFDTDIDMQRASRGVIPESSNGLDNTDVTDETTDKIGVGVTQGTRTGTAHRADTNKSEKPELIVPSNKILLFEQMLSKLSSDNEWTLFLERGEVPRQKCRSAHLVNGRNRQYCSGEIKISDALILHVLEIELRDKEALSTLLYTTTQPDDTKGQILKDLMSSNAKRNQKAMQWDRPEISKITQAAHFLGHPDSKNLTEEETSKTWAEKAKNKLLSL